MKILSEYATHHYIEEFEQCELFCPNCANKTVWEEQGLGDHYVGVDFLCTSCNHIFNLQGPYPIERSTDELKIEQLRTGVTKDPSTPRGN